MQFKIFAYQLAIHIVSTCERAIVIVALNAIGASSGAEHEHDVRRAHASHAIRTHESH